MDKLMWETDDPRRQAVKLRNPVSEEYACLRTSLLPPLMRCLSLNANRGSNNVRLFEMGTVFFSQGEGNRPVDTEKIGIIATGLRADSNWCSPPMPGGDFFFVKGALEALLAGTDVVMDLKKEQLPGFHPARGAIILWNGAPCGRIGQLHPNVCAEYDVKGPVVFAEIDAAPLYGVMLASRTARPLPKFHAVRRDIALIVDEAMESGRILAAVRGASPDFIESAVLFDLFKGRQIPEGKKGLAIAVCLRSAERTLKDAEIEKVMDIIRGALSAMGCELRGE